MTSEPIKILMVVAHYPFPVTGGLEKQARELSKELVTKGIKVSVLSRKFSPLQQQLEVIDGVTIHRMKWSKNRLLRFVTLPLKVLSFMLVNRVHYNIVHLHTLSWLSLYILCLSKLINKKTVLKMANVGEWGLPPLRKSVLGLLKLELVKSADVIIAMSRESKEEVRDSGYPIGRIFMTPNGITVTENSRYQALKKSNSCKIIFVGRLMPQKNLPSLLRVWADLQSRKGINAHLDICGSGPLEQQLKSLVKKLRISDSVVFKGHTENVYEHLNKADIFVLPSTAEGNSNAILEAMVSGLPIVSTNVGGTTMQVGPNGAKYISEVNNDDELLENLLRLISNRKERTALGREMVERSKDFFSIDTVSSNYIKMYSFVDVNRESEVYKISNEVFN
jgi:glycosyltransferase involved in cell wall biosynthesis